MQNIPAGLIPYNHEKYLTGKYIAETRGGFRPDEVVKMGRASQPIIYIDKKGCASCCHENGAWSGVDSEFDLFLRQKTAKKWISFFTNDRPKTVKKWHPVFKGMLCNSEHECLINWDHPNNSLVKAVEVEVNEE